MNYREVKCSDRLPPKDPDFWVTLKVDGVVMATWPNHTYHSLVEGGGKITGKDGSEDVAWLEPYELPTEEEIMEILMGEGCGLAYTLYETEADKLAKAITKLIKGEKQ